MQFVLDDGSNPMQATVDMVTYFPNLKRTLYADVVLWENASPELKITLEGIVAKHKEMLRELDKRTATIRYAGIYRSPPTGWYPDTTPGAVPSKTGFASYLRFYPDCTVLSVGSGDDSEQVATWFKRGHEDIGSGQYSLRGNRLQFTTKSKWGDVDYSGVVAGDGLKLTWHSHVNGTSRQETYGFVKVAVAGDIYKGR